MQGNQNATPPPRPFYPKVSLETQWAVRGGGKKSKQMRAKLQTKRSFHPHQEPITRSLQRTHIPVTAFSQGVWKTRKSGSGTGNVEINQWFKLGKSHTNNLHQASNVASGEHEIHCKLLASQGPWAPKLLSSAFPCAMDDAAFWGCSFWGFHLRSWCPNQ